MHGVCANSLVFVNLLPAFVQPMFAEEQPYWCLRLKRKEQAVISVLISGGSTGVLWNQVLLLPHMIVCKVP